MESKNKMHKILGATLSSLAVAIFFIYMLGSITYFQCTEEVVMPWSAYAFTLCIFGIPLLVIIINLIVRIREILGGEEDEASKY